MDGLGVTKVTEVDYCAHPGWLTESLGATGNGFAEQITGRTREVDVFVVLTGDLPKFGLRMLCLSWVIWGWSEESLKK